MVSRKVTVMVTVAVVAIVILIRREFCQHVLATSPPAGGANAGAAAGNAAPSAAATADKSAATADKAAATGKLPPQAGSETGKTLNHKP